MNTSRSGFRSGWASNQACRRRRTSARCCSQACAVFFERHAVPVEQPPDRALGHRQAMPRVQVCRDLAQGDVRRLVNQRQDFLGMGLDPVRAVVTALRPRPDIARPPPPIHPFDRRRGRNPEAARRRAPHRPLSTADTSRSRRSLERGFVMQAGLLHQPTSNEIRSWESQKESVSSENALAVALAGERHPIERRT